VKTSGDGHAADGQPILQFSGVLPLRNGLTARGKW